MQPHAELDRYDGDLQDSWSETLMNVKTLLSILGIIMMWITALVFSWSSIGYWRAAFATGFTGLATTKVITTSFLAIIAWTGVAILHRRRRGAD